MRDLIKQRKQSQQTWADCNAKLKQCASSQALVPLTSEIEPIFIDLSFEAYPNPTLRKELLNMPTSFALPKEAVDNVIRAGGELLENSLAFQALKKELQSNGTE
jgi:hypothetical protein